jgi:hypothetical protein
VVVLSDWPPGITRGNFRRAVDALEEEIATNGAYRQVSAVVYDSNNDLGDMTLTWLNPSATVALPESIRRVLDAAAREQRSARGTVVAIT